MSDDILDAIERARAVNNKNWVALLRLAVRVAPLEAKNILKDINEQDRKIGDLLQRLAG